MGVEENTFWKRTGIPSDRLTLSEIWAQEKAERDAEEKRQIENARADSNAVWQLADYYLPADVREMAERWKMNETLIEMWRGAFIEGWRAAHRR